MIMALQKKYSDFSYFNIRDIQIEAMAEHLAGYIIIDNILTIFELLTAVEEWENGLYFYLPKKNINKQFNLRAFFAKFADACNNLKKGKFHHKKIEKIEKIINQYNKYFFMKEYKLSRGKVTNNYLKKLI